MRSRDPMVNGLSIRSRSITTKANKPRQTDPYQPPSFDEFPQFQPQPCVKRPHPLVGSAAL